MIKNIWTGQEIQNKTFSCGGRYLGRSYFDRWTEIFSDGQIVQEVPERDNNQERDCRTWQAQVKNGSFVVEVLNTSRNEVSYGDYTEVTLWLAPNADMAKVRAILASVKKNAWMNPTSRASTVRQEMGL